MTSSLRRYLLVLGLCLGAWATVVNGSETTVNLLMMGLANSGKSAIVDKLNLPTEVFKNIGYDKVELEVVSLVNGQIEPSMREDFRNSRGLIFVVDSADRNRIGEAKSVLNYILNEDELRGEPLLVLANKQDSPGAMTAPEVAQQLNLHSIVRNRKWTVQAASAISGDGLYEGIAWLLGQL